MQSIKTDADIDESWIGEKADGGPLVSWVQVIEDEA
jgi:hypothetical protein